MLRKTDGTGGLSLSNVRYSFEILNGDFNPHHIFFVWDGYIDYIDDSYLFNTLSSSIFSINNHQDGIDIYLYGDNTSGEGLANGVGNSAELYVSGKYWDYPYQTLANTHVISHEMGHVLFLYHTHHGTYNEGGNDNPCAELVNGSNSNICGDYIEDTPADPHLQFNVNPTTYQWNDSGYDANGDPYAPDVRQIMSYTNINCMQYFSVGQGDRMRAAIETLQYLQNVRTQCIISGDSILYDNYKNYKIIGLSDSLSVSWSLSGDNASNFILQNDTPSLNQCRITKVEGVNFTGSTSLTLTAHVIYNGTTIKTLTKQIIAPYISGPLVPCGFTTYTVESRPANSTVEWSSSGVNMGYDTDPSGLMPDDSTAYVIINNDYETIHGMLTATVKVNGNEVGTLTKQVDTGGDFSTTWYQGTNSTPANLPNHAIIELTGGGHIYMQSNDFIGANVTHSSSGILVQNWSHVGNTISFSPLFPAFLGGIIRIEGIVPNNCKKFDVRFTKIDPISPFLLSISQSGQTCLFSLDVEQNIKDVECEAVDIPSNWQLAISEGETGKVVYEAGVSSREISVNTDGWRTGVYLGTALVEGRHVTCKFVVSK